MEEVKEEGRLGFGQDLRRPRCAIEQSTLQGTYIPLTPFSVAGH